ILLAVFTNTMPPNGKKQSLPPNVLGNLPENVIDDILSRLSLRDAVRTSMLSKNWRYKWCRLTQLKLDQTLWETTNDLIPPTVKITDIIYQLLTLHVGHISKFILSVFDLINCPKIDNLIYFLSRNGIQHLVLQFPIVDFIMVSELKLSVSFREEERQSKLLAPVLWSAVDEIPASFSNVTYNNLRAVKIKGVAGA
ncbi:PREDICTED: F-box/FBD/LRR-repeat protein At1g13570-like, partial [Nicotiana attenuata]|uniref:F-box/FBD/LRR-repeat protein At1g13570-like n=1 Tax=Nicotiana attenuata TaxID=49451 RepID=UPI000905973D